MRSRPLVLLGWTALLGAAIAGLTAAGTGALAAPPVGSPGSWGAWADGREPLEAGFAVARLAVLAVAWYLLLATLVTTASHLLGLRPLAAVADVVALPFVHRAVHAALGVGLVATSVAVAGTAGRSARPPVATVADADARLVLRSDAPATPGFGTSEPPGTTQDDSEGFATMRRAPEDPATTATTSTTTVTGAGAGARTPPLPPPAPGDVDPAGRDSGVPPAPDDGDGSAVAAVVPPTWTVAPGEHLWSIAETVLARAWARPAADDEVAPYWEALVEANRAVLADPANADLIYPAQVLTVPSPPPPAG